MKAALTLFLYLAVTCIARAADISAVPVEKLIDDLTQIDSQAPGLHGTASVRGFIGEDKALKFGGGVLGSPAPTIPPAMRELARRGTQVLPDLIRHLDDSRLLILNVYHFTQYFESRVMRERPYLTKQMCIRVIEAPIRSEPQEGDRYRFWGAVNELGGRYLRVVTLSDKLTIHNAFLDRRFRP